MKNCFLLASPQEFSPLLLLQKIHVFEHLLVDGIMVEPVLIVHFIFDEMQAELPIHLYFLVIQVLLVS
jgi:hypothetical protein